MKRVLKPAKPGFRSAGTALISSGIALGLMTAAAGTVLAQQGHNLERGQEVYEHWCSHCHAEGRGHPGTQSLQIKYDGSLPAVLTEREDLTPEVVKTFVRQGVLSMAPFRKTEITDEELDDMAAWLTSQ